MNLARLYCQYPPPLCHHSHIASSMHSHSHFLPTRDGFASSPSSFSSFHTVVSFIPAIFHLAWTLYFIIIFELLNVFVCSLLSCLPLLLLRNLNKTYLSIFLTCSFAPFVFCTIYFKITHLPVTVFLACSGAAFVLDCC